MKRTSTLEAEGQTSLPADDKSMVTLEADGAGPRRQPGPGRDGRHLGKG